jgi:hypothetical protein
MIIRASGWRSPMTTLISTLVIAGTAAVWSLLAQTPDLPAAYPRPGTTKVLENARVVVWDINWLKQQYPLHRHRYDLAGVYYSPGDRMIIGQDGGRRPVTTKAWETAFQRSGVTHVEEGASDPPLRALFIELKEQTASGKVDTTNSPPGFAATAGMPFVENDRVAGWLLTQAQGRHRHQRDAVVLWFEGDQRGAAFIAQGTVHDDEGHSKADHLYVYELK